MDDSSWAAVGAVSSTIYTVGFVASMGFLLRQVRETRLARETEVLMKLYDRLIAIREKRMLVFDSSKRLAAVANLVAWDAIRRDQPVLAEAVNSVSMEYHLAGLMLRQGLLKEPVRAAFLKDIGEVFLQLYAILLPVVQLERERSGITYRTQLDYLAKQVRSVLRH